MFPNPTADPAVARIMPNLLPKFPLVSIMLMLIHLIYALYPNSDYPKTPNWFKNTSKMRIGHTNLTRKK